MSILSRVIRKLHIATVRKLTTRTEISCIHSEIEMLRNELSTSSIEISITDYGAGSLDLNLTAEEMYQGRVVVRTIGEVCQNYSKTYKLAFLLFKLVREFRPSVCLELGAALGMSAAC